MAYDTTLHQTLELRKTELERGSDEQPICLTRDNLSSKYFPKCSRSLLIAITVICLAYAMTSMNRINHTDSWGHLNYGRWIVNHGTLPNSDPFAAAPVGSDQFLNLPWLAQVSGYLTWSAFGAEGLVLIHSLLAAAGVGLLILAVRLRGVSLIWAAVGGAVMYALALPVTGTLRPQLVGMVGVPLTLLLCTLLPRHRLSLVALPLLFMVWANMHGSFAIGLTMLALYAAGQVIETFLEKKSLRATLADGSCRTWTLALALSITASAVNPIGPGIFWAVASFGGNAALNNISEWRAMSFDSLSGLLFFGSLVLGIVLYKTSGRKLTLSEILLALFFAVLTMTSIRMLAWWAMLFPFLATPYAAAAWDRLRNRIGLAGEDSEEAPEATTTSMNTLIGMAIVFVAIVLAPPSHNLLTGKSRGIGVVTVSGTPIYVADEIKTRGLAGNFFAPMDWSDYIVWHAGEPMKPLAYTHVHLLPAPVWNDYLKLREGDDWLARVRRYDIDYMIVSRQSQRPLYEKMIAADRSPSSPAVVLWRNERCLLVKINPPAEA